MEEGVVVTKTKLMLSFLVVLCASITCTTALDAISANQTIRYGDTIVSPQETFELGFFRAGRSTNYYIGIWYKRISNGTVVWVANRNTPLTNSSGELTLTRQGVLLLRNATGDVIWSSGNSNSQSVRNPVGQLLDSGNFIVHEDGDTDLDNPIWQSFDFPTDHLLPGMKFGRDLVTGVQRNFTSWKSLDDPAVGDFTAFIDTRGFPQMVLTGSSEIVFRAGPWNGQRFSGEPDLRPNPIYNFSFVLNEREIYYQYNLINNSVFTRVVLPPDGQMDRLYWVDSRQEWDVYLSPETDNCDRFAICGPFASCNINDSPACQCLEGFEPVSPDQWRVADWDLGCQQRTPLDCGAGEGFNRFTNMKLPDTQQSRFNQTWTIEECERVCKNDCSCTAYTYSNVSGSRSGCVMWFGDLIDMRTFPENNGDDLFIRLPPSELVTENSESSSSGGQVRIIVPIVSVILVVLVCILLTYWYRRRRRTKQGTLRDEFRRDSINNRDNEDLELPLFSFSTLLKATNNFSIHNKIGEGGFGPVYKGVLEDGQEIAVKRLAETSTQGLHEFKNEVISISKLQHRNLVKLLGCCIEGAETMLIYEYLPNKGLDSFIFDKTQNKLLDWPARFKIINGIARGLLYLHQDSRLRIIHRDLKVSNILLDSEMNPKISDFGMARSFGGNQIEANTNRVVGTYGYMAPEYAGDGIFSVKSDVYSFGVLVLEIVSEQKNRGFFHEEHSNNLIGHAWELHKQGKSLQLVAKSILESISMSEVLRSIHVGLLCVQRRPEDRPTMPSVVLMLGSGGPMPSPKEPGFFIGKSTEDARHSSATYDTSSTTNDLSITVLNGGKVLTVVTDWVYIERKRQNKNKEKDHIHVLELPSMAEGELTKTKMILTFLIVLFTSLTYTTTAIDTIIANQTIRYGETIVSPQETFELGFFNSGNSTNYYIGIWYKKISTTTVVWVANRNTPVTNTAGDLTLTFQGVLILRNATGNVIWSSSNSSEQSSVRSNPVGRLLDSGNFIIHQDDYTDSDNPIWQSFDFPTDNFLSGMKFGRDLVTGIQRNFTSWKSADDPAVGEFTAFIDTRGYPQTTIMKGSEIVFRSSPWNGLRFNRGPDTGYNFGFVLKQTEFYYQYNDSNSVSSRVMLTPSGNMDMLLWVDSKKEWNVYLSVRSDNCDRFGICGPFAICNINESPVCECLKGFEPTSPDQWTVGNWDQGCRQRTPLDCGPGEGFNRFSNLKMPDTQRSRFNQTWSLDECERVCKNDCACTAYTHSDITESESGCLLWFDNLVDMRTYSETGKEIFIRVPPSELDTTENGGGGQIRIIVPIASVLLVIIGCIFLIYRYKRHRRMKEGTLRDVFGHHSENKNDNDDLELPLFSISTLLKATNNFSCNNKLGEGGYGPVYKGILEDGQEIAVKRLAETSTQGLNEFKNEVISISKLQHRNLVKLLGCCIEGAEKMLIYEHLPNKGLDSFIFDKTQSKMVDWPVRFKIINGIARGLLYLHQDSRLRIIHRDLKVSNILLDSEMNPKISDFGMARSFGGNQIEANTNRVVGTYGYMAPEYAGNGKFSIKSDVYSFGVLVLEIVSEEKNREFFHEEHSNNLIGHAWELHKEGKSLQLVSKSLLESINMSQVLRSIHVGLLCVQRRPEDRPTMTSVVLMLASEGPMPSPKEPGFFIGKNTEYARHYSGAYDTSSTNDLSITILNGR
ncbi:hypothetical protein LXL04_037567 [Taraxacum kok-saghyz]